MTFTVRDEWQLACPKCGSDERLQVSLRSMADVTPDGTEPFGDHEWDNASFMRCAACGHAATVSNFYVEEARS